MRATVIFTVVLALVSADVDLLTTAAAGAEPEPLATRTVGSTSLPATAGFLTEVQSGAAQGIVTESAVWYWAVSSALVIFAGCASGLTVGLMGLDPIQLQVLASEGSAEERAGVNAVLQVVRQHHLLLVTLLLANSVAMEALPIFLDRLVPPWAAVALSVTAILLFGEIIPQALCTGPWQMHIARKSAPFVRVLIALLFVVAWPIAKLLDSVLGRTAHKNHYARAHLKALIRMHERPHGTANDAASALGADEVVVIEGALDMAGKTLHEIMLPMEKVFMLEASTPMDNATLELILKGGHSRIPVFSGRRNNLKGIILTKTLITVNSSEGIPAGMLTVQRRPIFAKPDTELYDLLNVFQKGHTHFAFVTKEPEIFDRAFKEQADIPESAEILGIATLEDVIEELIQEEIYDEFDAKTSRDPNLLIVPHRTSIRDLPAIIQHSDLYRNGAVATPGLTTPLIPRTGGVFSETHGVRQSGPFVRSENPDTSFRRTGSKTRVMWARATQPNDRETKSGTVLMLQPRSQKTGYSECVDSPHTTVATTTSRADEQVSDLPVP